jgi:hypothetical protein
MGKPHQLICFYYKQIRRDADFKNMHKLFIKINRALILNEKLHSLLNTSPPSDAPQVCISIGCTRVGTNVELHHASLLSDGHDKHTPTPESRG